MVKKLLQKLNSLHGVVLNQSQAEVRWTCNGNPFILKQSSEFGMKRKYESYDTPILQALTEKLKQESGLFFPIEFKHSSKW